MVSAVILPNPPARFFDLLDPFDFRPGAAGLKFRTQPDIDQRFCQLRPDHSRTESHALAIVTHPGTLSRIDVVTDGRPNPRNFVGGNANADSGATHQDPAFVFPVSNSLAYFHTDLPVQHGIPAEHSIIFNWDSLAF